MCDLLFLCSNQLYTDHNNSMPFSPDSIVSTQCTDGTGSNMLPVDDTTDVHDLETDHDSDKSKK